MAVGGNMELSDVAEHNFDYANTKLAFIQEVGYVIIDKRLQSRVVLHKKDIDNIISDIKAKKLRYKKYYTEKCHVVNENGKDILCHVETKFTGKNTYAVKMKQILCIDDLFDILFELHMQKPCLDEREILNNLFNCVLFSAFINLFWKSCETCNTNIKNDDFMSFRVIGEMTALNMNSPDGKFTDILMYIERNTNFVLLRPLKSLTGKELASELLTIFTDFGSPIFLHSDMFMNTYRYTNVLNIIKSLKPPFKVPFIDASSRDHKTTATSIKVKQMLVEWMEKTGSSNWAIGAHIVQWQMNTSKVEDTYIRSRVVTGPIQSPYHAMFGLLPHTDLIKIKDKRHSASTLAKEKVLMDCSQCNLPVYKVFKCNFCKKLCHFSCCVRYVEQEEGGLLLINKCVSCANNVNMCVDEEIILGT